MNSKILIFHVILFVMLNIQCDGVRNQVDAAPKHIPRSASWFGSLEKIDFQNAQMTSSTTEYPEVKPHLRKKLRKKKIIRKKKAKEMAATDKQEIKKRKKHIKKKAQRRFVKTMVRERDREFNSSSSIESGDRRKPVDIIVHIKMHE